MNITLTKFIITKHNAILFPTFVSIIVTIASININKNGLFPAKIGINIPAIQELIPVSSLVNTLEINRAAAISINISQVKEPAAALISKSGLPSFVLNAITKIHKIIINPTTPICVLIKPKNGILLPNKLTSTIITTNATTDQMAKLCCVVIFSSLFTFGNAAAISTFAILSNLQPQSFINNGYVTIIITIKITINAI